ncbi:nephrin-like isoform X2 [Thrips palmi]|uniref:Nephrin-like isoform X2 n=1 Tax=Thrips palmi TaxID=161013 RepID=A0A6P8YWV4_THRPL|nr:nephrin-like isoform X2 [Thrips palmi]
MAPLWRLAWLLLLAHPLHCSSVHRNRPENDDLMMLDLDKPIPVLQVQALLGKKASMPCDVTPSEPEDFVHMVLWFRESEGVPEGEPLYSFDGRGRPVGQELVYSATEAFGTRAFFRTATTPAELVVDNLSVSDEGLYRCRVDFRNSPTRNVKVNLTVIVPPSKPVIFDSESKDPTKLVAPYNEGDSVILLCEVKGGRPRPRVVWFMENMVLDESVETREDGVTINRLTLPNVGRTHLHSRLICQASNTNLAMPLAKAVVLDVNLKPTSVTITTRERHLEAGKTYEIECKSQGSRPSAVMSWWKGPHPLRHQDKQSEADGVALSVLKFSPTIDDDGKYLTCRAENTAIPGSVIEDKLLLNVEYQPLVSIKMGTTLKADEIKEGDDVYFECEVRANPKVYRLVWYHDGTEIAHNQTAGVVLSDRSLVLRRINRAAAGSYTCLAANSMGKSGSNVVKLSVMYAPRCREDRDQLLGAVKNERIALHCDLDANPEQVSVHWTFNHSGTLQDVASRVSQGPAGAQGAHSSGALLYYTPTLDQDYGTLACYGTNSVGRQTRPCVFQIAAAVKPFSPANCTLANMTGAGYLRIECVEGFDGGLPQWFLLQMVELPGMQVRHNLTLAKGPPVFELTWVPAPGVMYQARVFAVNTKGSSDPVIIEDALLSGISPVTGPVVSSGLSPVLMVLVAISCSLLLIGLSAVLALYVCRRTPPADLKHQMQASGRGGQGQGHGHQSGANGGAEGRMVLIVRSPSGANGPVITSGAVVSPEDADPDIIPSKHERRPLRGFMKMHRTPPQRRRRNRADDGVDDVEDDDKEAEEPLTNHRGSTPVLHSTPPMMAVSGHATLPHPPKDSGHNIYIPTANSFSHSNNSIAHKGVTACSPLNPVHAMERLMMNGSTKATLAHHEPITTSNRIQESCI